MTCKICHGHSLRKLHFINGFQIWKCDHCGFGQVDIAAAELASFYDKAYFDGDKANFDQAVGHELPPSHIYWLERHLRLAGGAARPLKVLDIGPGLGVGFGKYLRRHHPQITYESVEISQYAVDSIRERGFIVHQGRCAETHIMEACRDRFDLIVGTEVIEHDPEPREFLSAVRTMLKPGGLCAFTTGNLAGLQARRLGSRWYYFDPPAHVSFFTPKAARTVFESEGFTDIEAWRVGLSYIALKLRTHIPGILTLAHLLSLPTGMSLSARRAPEHR